MSEQLSLLEPKTVARRSDPDTSKAAAEQVTAEQIRGRQARAVLEALRVKVLSWGALTSAELAAHSNIDRYVCARRLPELEAINKVCRRKPRTCRITGRAAVTWAPVDGL